MTDSGSLTVCDKTFNHPSTAVALSGQNTFYKTFVFLPSAAGSYTFTPTASAFQNRLILYQGGFSPTSLLANVYGVSSGGALSVNGILAGIPMVLVITSATAGETGTYTVAVTSGPALVTKSPAPTISSLATSVNVFRGDAATLTVVSPTPGVGYQWYQGTACTSKTAIKGATSASYTTGAFNDNPANQYWVELTSSGGYLLSSPVQIEVQPKAVNDSVHAGQHSFDRPESGSARQ